jgi:hypothetical protein
MNSNMSTICNQKWLEIFIAKLKSDHVRIKKEENMLISKSLIVCKQPEMDIRLYIYMMKLGWRCGGG